MKAWGILPHQWDDLPRGEQAILLAHEANEAELCPSCSRPLDNTVEPFAIVRHECKGCQERHKAESREKRDKPGIFYAVRRTIQ